LFLLIVSRRGLMRLRAPSLQLAAGGLALFGASCALVLQDKKYPWHWFCFRRPGFWDVRWRWREYRTPSSSGGAGSEDKRNGTPSLIY